MNSELFPPNHKVKTAYLFLGRSLVVTSTLELYIFALRVNFDLMFSVEPRRVCEVDPQPDLHFVALH